MSDEQTRGEQGQPAQAGVGRRFSLVAKRPRKHDQRKPVHEDPVQRVNERIDDVIGRDIVLPEVVGQSEAERRDRPVQRTVEGGREQGSGIEAGDSDVPVFGDVARIIEDERNFEGVRVDQDTEECDCTDR